MKKIIFILLAVVLVVALLLGCAPAAGPTPSHLVFAGSSLGSGFYAMGVGFTDILNKYSDLTVNIQSIGSSVMWLPLFKSGEADIGLINVDEGREAYLGLFGHEEATKGQGWDFRTIMRGSPLVVGIYVKNENTDIQSIPDLRGKKVPSEYGGMVTMLRSMKSFLANGGLTYDDVIPVPVTAGYGPDVKSAFLEDRVACLNSSMASGFTKELDAMVGIRYLSIDTSPEAVARMKEWYISYPYPVKAGQFAGVREDIYARAHDVTLAARPDLHNDVVYKILEVVWDNYEELAPVHPLLRQWTPDRFVSTDITVPYHSGAIKFYKDKGVWTSEMEEHQKQLEALK